VQGRDFRILLIMSVMYVARRNTISILLSRHCRARVFVGAMRERKTFKGIQPGFTVSHTYYDRFQERKTSKFRNSLVHLRNDALSSRKYWMAHRLSFRYLHGCENLQQDNIDLKVMTSLLRFA